MAKTVNLTAVEKLSTYNEHTNLIVEQEGELNRVAIADLKISSSEIYKQDEEPIDAPEGALWIDTDEESSSGGGGVSSWNDLTDKPFGDDIGGDTLTWDGNSNGLVSLEGDFLFKVSDVIASLDDLSNGMYLVFNDKGTLVEHTTNDWTLSTFNLSEGEIAIVKTDSEGNSFDAARICLENSGYEPGIYFAKYNDNAYTTSLTINGYNKFYSIKKIDKKYLPDIMPEVTTEDNGKFLRVVDGAWAAVSVPNAEEASF